MKRDKIYTLVIYALFTAISIVLGTTSMGFIYLPIAAVTTMHMPTIIGGYSLGVRGGTYLGFIFGLTSLLACFRTPDATAQLILGTNTGFGVYNIFLILAIIFLPRILCGVFSALTYKAIAKFDKSEVAAMGVAAFVGSMTNTVFYLGGLYVFAFEGFSAAAGMPGATYLQLLKAILAVVSVNGVIEAIAAVIICTIVGKAISIARKKAFIR